MSYKLQKNEQSMLNSKLDDIKEKINKLSIKTNSLNAKIYQLKEKKENEQ